MFNVVLYHPRIPQNTGAVARLCAATNATLYLVRPLGFRIDSTYVKKAALDYWEQVTLRVIRTLDEIPGFHQKRFYLVTKKGKRCHTEVAFDREDALIFGSEDSGLPEDLLAANIERTIRIPMQNERVRSLNLASSVAIVLYEALRQMT